MHEEFPDNKIPTYKFALREDLKDHPEFLPTRAEPHASGWDVRAGIEEKLIVEPFQYIKIDLGFRAFCPEGWWLQLKPRSSSFGKKSLHALYGTIDCNYEGSMIFAAQYLPQIQIFKKGSHSLNSSLYEICGKDNLSLVILPGEALGQLIPIKRQEMTVESISNAEYDALCKTRNGVRKDGGFGSTGI